MKDIFNDIVQWEEEGKDFALARVVNTWRSAPRQVGAGMAISEEGNMIGSVSGGCVEKSVVKKALALLQSNSEELLSYGVGNEDAWEVGLSCGGKIEVFVQRFPGSIKDTESNRSIWKGLKEAIQDNRGAVYVSGITGSGQSFLCGEDGSVIGDYKEDLKAKAVEALQKRQSEIIEYEGEKYFLHVFTRKDRLLLVGSAHITSELIALATFYDFETIVIDPRDTFARQTNYSVKPGSLFVEWPQEVMNDLVLDEYTYAVNLSHDPKIDDESLAILLRKPVAYIGALGSKKTHEKRLERLMNRGFSEDELKRIHAPVGLGINAQLPGEIALSIMAEIIKVKNTPGD
ncbi:MAG: XdhC family protein [Cyclobacteriaceae bacterium]|nr:XdhC family protein [Cyclobacteriaceae bacterium]